MPARSGDQPPQRGLPPAVGAHPPGQRRALAQQQGCEAGTAGGGAGHRQGAARRTAKGSGPSRQGQGDSPGSSAGGD
eukprot:5932896-Alexandrium_andersonii.AAC.1